MKIGLWLVNVGPWADPEAAAVLASEAERLGFDSLWTGDHVLFPKEYRSRYPYSESGVAPIPGGTPIAEPLTHLAWLAGESETIGLATGVMVLPLRNPVLIAKQIATLDVLSGGRVSFGVGIGWLREEFDALGIPFEERAARLEEGVELARRLWSGDRVSFDGEFVQCDEVSISPTPAREHGIPVIVGGTSAAAAKRAGRIGDGWISMAAGPERIAELLAVVHHAAEEAGRDPDAIEVTHGIPPGSEEYTRALRDPDEIKRLEEAGVDRVLLMPPATSAEQVPAALEGLVPLI
jgi:probable F420-dependent oxidoreductase